MKDADKTKTQLKEELTELRRQIAELEVSEAGRKRAEDALIVSEEKYRMLVETMSEGLGIQDKNGLITYVNDRLCTMWEYSRAETIGRPVTDFLDESNRRILEEQMAKRRRGEHDSYELTWSGKDGQKIDTIMSPKPIFDANGQPDGSFAVITDITERKRAEDALRESEKQYRNLVDNALVGIYKSNLKGEVLYVNDALLEIMEFDSLEDMVSSGVVARYKNPEDRRTLLQNLKGSGHVNNFEVDQVTKNGNTKNIILNAVLEEDVISGMIMDITERKQVEKALRESEARFRTAIESLPFDFFVIDKDGRYAIQNSTCRERWGDLIGKRPEDVGVDDDTLTLWESNNRKAFAGDVVEGEVSFEVGGEMGFYHNVLSPITDQGQIRGILGVNIDITDRRRAEEELQKAHDELERRVEERTAQLVEANKKLMGEIGERRQVEEELRRSEERYRAIVDTQTELICRFQPDGTLTFVNDTICRSVGKNKEELIGESFYPYIHPDDRETVREQRESLSQDNPVVATEERVLMPNGEIHWWHWVNQAILDDDHDLVEVQGVGRDVTERRRMAEALEFMRSKLLNLQEVERSRLSKVLHDTIGQNISILDFNLTTIEEVLDEVRLERIKGLMDNMRAVIRETGDKLRDISSGLHPRQLLELGLVQGINDYIERFQRRTELEADTVIQVEELHVEESAAVNLYRIIQEAFTNIVKHSKCRSVFFAMEVVGSDLLVRIQDDGVGFSMEDISRLDIDQRGLGLFIMEERAKAIGGSLEIHSEPNQGTEVRVEIPL